MLTNRSWTPVSYSADAKPESAGKSPGSTGEKVAPRRKKRKIPSSENVSCSMSSRQRVTWAFRTETTQPQLEPSTASFLFCLPQLPKVFSASPWEISLIVHLELCESPAALAILTI